MVPTPHACSLPPTSQAVPLGHRGSSSPAPSRGRCTHPSLSSRRSFPRQMLHQRQQRVGQLVARHVVHQSSADHRLRPGRPLHRHVGRVDDLCRRCASGSPAGRSSTPGAGRTTPGSRTSGSSAGRSSAPASLLQLPRHLHRPALRLDQRHVAVVRAGAAHQPTHDRRRVGRQLL